MERRAAGWSTPGAQSTSGVTHSMRRKYSLLGVVFSFALLGAEKQTGIVEIENVKTVH